MNRPPSHIEICGDVAYVHLRNRDGVVIAKAIIDKSNVDVVAGKRWYLTSAGYAASKNGAIVYMHRLIACGNQIDHINRNKLDNRRSNLRACAQSQNIANIPARRNSKTGVKGVHPYKGGKKFCAQITCNRKVFTLGVYETIDEAKRAYDKKAKELFGEFAAL